MTRNFKNYIHLMLSLVINIIYGFPSRKIKVIGVTGTDGKTTTVNLIYHILKENGKRVAVVSTTGAVINNKNYDIGFHVTTPSSFDLQKYIKKALDEGNKYLVLETTSHGLDQNRTWGINFEIGVLTNVTHEHLDYHKTYERYVEAKFKLLENSKKAIINKDDKSYELILKIKNEKSKMKNKKWITFGMGKDADVTPVNFPFETKLIGEFNKYNILAAVAVCKEIGLEDKEIKNAILTFKLPSGRQEIVYDKNFKVIIDFAHTPNAFKELLRALYEIKEKRIIHVFGCAGKRDSAKRPLMGELSSNYADIIILTAEDSRDEETEKIIEDISKGISKSRFSMVNVDKNFTFEHGKKYLFKIPDRKKAIELAIAAARKGDLVLLTGKGHEKSINYGREEEFWNEFKVAEDAIKGLNKNI